MLVAIHGAAVPMPAVHTLVHQAARSRPPARRRVVRSALHLQGVPGFVLHSALHPTGLAGLFDPVAGVIQTVEGWFLPGSVAARLNNPGNLMYAGQAGAVPHSITGSDGKVRVFAEFPNAAAGQAALDSQIALDAGRGLTIAQFAAKYAPAQDGNDPASYAAQIARATGLSVNDPLSLAQASDVPAPAPVNMDPVPEFSLGLDYTAPIDDRSAGVSPAAWATLAVLGGLYAVAASA